MNKLIYFVVLFCCITITLSDNCVCRLTTAIVVVPATTRTYQLRCFYDGEDCEFPFKINIGGGASTTRETLSSTGRQIIKRTGEIVKYNNTWIESVKVYDGERYCFDDDDDGITNGVYIGSDKTINNSKKIQHHLKELYYEPNTDNLLQRPIEDNFVNISILNDESAYMKFYSLSFAAITSDIYTTLPDITNAINQIGNVATYGTYEIDPVDVNVGHFPASDYFPLFPLTLNYRSVPNIIEQCCLSSFDIEQIKASTNIYTDCRTGSIFTTSTSITCGYEMNVDICRTLLSEQSYITQSEKYYFDMEVILDLSVSDYQLDTTLYEAGTSITTLSKLTVNFIPYEEYCLLLPIEPENHHYLTSCTITSTEILDIPTGQLPTSMSIIKWDKLTLVYSECENIEITCVGTTITPNYLSKSSTSVVLKEHTNTNVEFRGLVNSLNLKNNVGNMIALQNWGIFFVLSLIIGSILFIIFYYGIYRNCSWGCFKCWRNVDYIKEMAWDSQRDIEAKQIKQEGLNDRESDKIIELRQQTEKEIRNIKEQNYEKIGKITTSPLY